MADDKPYLVEIYKDDAGEWRWRAVAGNNEKVGDSGEGYVHRNDCVAIAAHLFPDASVEVKGE